MSQRRKELHKSLRLMQDEIRLGASVIVARVMQNRVIFSRCFHLPNRATPRFFQIYNVMGSHDRGRLKKLDIAPGNVNQLAGSSCCLQYAQGHPRAQRHRGRARLSYRQ